MPDILPSEPLLSATVVAIAVVLVMVKGAWR